MENSHDPAFAQWYLFSYVNTYSPGFTVSPSTSQGKLLNHPRNTITVEGCCQFPKTRQILKVESQQH